MFIPVCRRVGLVLSSVAFIPAIAFFYTPAAGYRNRESGALTNVGSNGYYWSSSSYAAGNINAGNLNFNSGNVYPLNNNNRANGFSVRCVQASTGSCFLFFCLFLDVFKFKE